MSHTWHHGTADSRSSPLGHYARINENREKLWQRNLLSSFCLFGMLSAALLEEILLGLSTRDLLLPTPKVNPKDIFKPKQLSRWDLWFIFFLPLLLSNIPRQLLAQKHQTTSYTGIRSGVRGRKFGSSISTCSLTTDIAEGYAGLRSDDWLKNFIIQHLP